MSSVLGSLISIVLVAPVITPTTEAPTTPTVPTGPIVVPDVEPSSIEPRHDALEHLARAQEHEATGMLEAAEAEASAAIAMEPDDAPAYLVRAQIRMALADHAGDEDDAARRSKAALLRLAAQDVAAYVEHARLPSDGAAWFESRRRALLREADGLDPPPPEPIAEPEPTPAPKPVIPVSIPTSWSSPSHDNLLRQRTGTLLGVGILGAAASVGTAAVSLRIEQRCAPDGLCGARWRAEPSLLGPAVVLAALGTTSMVLAVATAPGLDRPRSRRAVMASTLALGATAALVGTITGALAGARWSTPASPSDDATLGATQGLGNASVAGFATALPLLGAGITAWVRGRLDRPAARVARRGRPLSSLQPQRSP